MSNLSTNPFDTSANLNPSVTSNPFGSANASANPFSGNINASSTTQNPFSENTGMSSTINPFAGSNATASGNPSGGTNATVSTPNPFAGSNASSSTPNPFGGSTNLAGSTNPFESSSNLPNQQASNSNISFEASKPSDFTSLFKTTPSLFDATQQSTLDSNKPLSTTNTQQFSSAVDQSSLMMSIKDNSLNLYNLTLQEIIDRHLAILDANIKDFQKDAKAVFDRDLRLIRSKNNYLEIQKKLADETVKLDELSQVLDFFETKLGELEMGEISTGAQVVEDFEKICAKFYEKVESFKDEQDDVLGLVNENYEIIENIDRKLDLLTQIRNLNK